MIIRQQSKVRALTDIALHHRAVHHPYLKAIAEGDLPDPLAALTDFAIQYQGYTSWFPRYLATVMEKLENPQHREFFAENLDEEKGNLDRETIQELEQMGIAESWVQGIPHPELFRRFQSSLGIDSQKQPLCQAAIDWRNDFLMSVENSSAAFAIGAMGLATEAMVKHIYRYIIRGIESQTDLPRRDYVFFELHCEVDDEHAELMMRVADDLIHGCSDAGDSNHFEEMRRGMIHALELRSTFWDAMHARAMQSSEMPEKFQGA